MGRRRWRVPPWVHHPGPLPRYTESRNPYPGEPVSSLALAPAETTGRGVLPRWSSSTAPRVLAAAAVGAEQAGRSACGVARIGEEGRLVPCSFVAVTENAYSNLQEKAFGEGRLGDCWVCSLRVETLVPGETTKRRG